jgi:heat shock protein HslJ
VKADGSISGSACNMYGARWKVDGNRITVTDGFSTDMACSEPDGVMAQETDYLQLLEQATLWSREGQKLTLASGGGPDERGRPLITAEVLFRPTS